MKWAGKVHFWQPMLLETQFEAILGWIDNDDLWSKLPVPSLGQPKEELKSIYVFLAFLENKTMLSPRICVVDQGSNPANWFEPRPAWNSSDRVMIQRSKCWPERLVVVLPTYSEESQKVFQDTNTKPRSPCCFHLLVVSRFTEAEKWNIPLTRIAIWNKSTVLIPTGSRSSASISKTTILSLLKRKPTQATKT